LQKAFDSGTLQFFAALESLREPDAFAQLLARVKAREWVVYAKRLFAGPEQVLDYVGRYTHRVATSNNRLLDIENGQVRFQWKDLSSRRPVQNDDPVSRRVHPAFLATRATRRVPTHSLLRLLGQPLSAGETGAVPSLARYADSG
jgi:hypothetical protein